jgi:hypothetical protein
MGHLVRLRIDRYLNASDEHLLDSMQRYGIQPLHRVAQQNDQEPPLPCKMTQLLTLSCR